MFRFLCIVFFLSQNANGQAVLKSGVFEEMNIAFDAKNNLITGYYENGTGYNARTGNAAYSCIFYLLGKVDGTQVNIKTNYPKGSEIIEGKLVIKNEKSISILLSEEHGGCWNVQHFVDEPVNLILEDPKPWIQIRYAVKDKVYFYSKPEIEEKRKAYILKGDIVYIERFDGQWAWCIYVGERTTTGWIKLEDLNVLPY